MSGWNDGGASGWNDNGGATDWNGGADASAASFKGEFAGDANDDSGATNGGVNDSFGTQGGKNGEAGAAGGGCRNCGQEGHYARECPEPRKGGGACFNCGEEGHTKAECTAPRKPNGPCRTCNEEGHFSATCPNRKCKNCQQPGHEAHECKNTKVINNELVASKSEDEAWVLLEQASEERDITDFKDAVQVLSKATPTYTYPELEKEFRKRGFRIFLIAMEKDHGDTWTNVNLQGEIGKKYAVSYFTSDKPQRPTLVHKWPKDAEDNIARLADAGVPLDRGVDKCNNCGEIGHKSRTCPQERVAPEQPKVFCHQCNEEGHRVRDCTQERKKPSRACKVCEGEDHIAKDCPNREKRACRNCGEEDHMAKDCTAERKVTCHNCEQEGHISKDCTQPRKKTDWSKVTCTICQKNGHSYRRCPDAPAEGAQNAGGDIASTDANGEMDSGAGWESNNQATNSAPAGWEQNDSIAPAPAVFVGGGGGW